MVSVSGGGKKPDEQSFFSPLLWAGTPQPDIVWYKDAVPISPVKIPRYRVLVGGSLQINGLLPDDTGMFQCFARNLAGEIQTNSYLAVTSTSVRPSVHPPAWDISKKLLLLHPPFPVRRSLSLLYSLIRFSVLFLILFSPPPPPPPPPPPSRLSIHLFPLTGLSPRMLGQLLVSFFFFPAQPVRFTKVSPKTRPDSRLRFCRVC